MIRRLVYAIRVGQSSPATTNLEDPMPATIEFSDDGVLRHLRAAEAELSELKREAGRGHTGELYLVVLIDLRKLIFVAAGFLPEVTRGAP